MKRLVLFDFDGTLTTRDTLWEFLKFDKGIIRFYLGIVAVSPVLVLYAVRILSNWKAKEMLLRFFIGSIHLTDFQDKCRSFANTKIPKLIRADAMNKLRDHQSAGDEIYVVSASPENWVKPFCDSLQVKTIATRLEVLDGRMTGTISGENCYGPEKVRRIREIVDLRNYSSIVAYGDSRGDREMLMLAREPGVK